MSTLPTPQDPGPIRACTISRDVQAFDLLIEDMDSLLGTNWGDIHISEALAYLAQPEAKQLEFLALALEAADEAQLDMLVQIVGRASIPTALTRPLLFRPTFRHEFHETHNCSCNRRRAGPRQSIHGAALTMLSA